LLKLDGVMRTLLFILCGALWLVPLAGSAQPASQAALEQAEARVQELEQGRAPVLQRLSLIEDERVRTQQALGQLQGGSESSLRAAERDRLRRKLAGLERQQQQHAQRLQELERGLRGESLALLALYEHTLVREADPALRARRDALQARLGMGPAPRSSSQIREQIEQAEQAESKLRRKAVQVASKIRQLRKQHQLAGDVARTMRDQVLFDEEERRLAQSRVVTRPEVNQSETAAADDTSNRQIGTGECAGANCGTPGAGGNVPPSYENSDGALDSDPSATGSFSGDSSWGATATGQARGSSALLSDLLEGSRVTTLLNEDVGTLLGRDGIQAGATADDELRELQTLRVELLRSADRLAREREQLESQARAPRP
jgi:hypothetical protein